MEKGPNKIVPLGFKHEQGEFLYIIGRAIKGSTVTALVTENVVGSKGREGGREGAETGP